MKGEKSMLKIIFLFLLSYPLLAFNFSVSPVGFNINLEKRSTHEVTLTNNNNKVMRIKIEPEQPEECTQDEYMGEWITIYPKMIILEPFEEKIVRFSIRKPEITMKEKYRSYLIFKELPGKVQNNIEGNVNIQILGEIAINLYGYSKKKELGETR